MAVHWSTEDCTPPNPVTPEEVVWRSDLIGGANVVCLSRLTDDNLDEWLFRIRVAQRVLDPKLFTIVLPKTTSRKKAADMERRGESVFKEVNVSADVLRRWRGMWTNACTMSRIDWLNAVIHKIVTSEEARAKRELNGTE